MQREDVAYEIAMRARERLNAEGAEPAPVSNKVLVPLLEKASCENLDDDDMIDRWASLLASASMKLSVQPRFIGILGELAGPQALCLDRIAFNNSDRRIFAYRDLADASLVFAGPYFTESLSNFIRDCMRDAEDVEAALTRLIELFSQPGVFLSVAVVRSGADDYFEYDAAAECVDFGVPRLGPEFDGATSGQVGAWS